MSNIDNKHQVNRLKFNRPAIDPYKITANFRVNQITNIPKSTSYPPLPHSTQPISTNETSNSILKTIFKYLTSQISNYKPRTLHQLIYSNPHLNQHNHTLYDQYQQSGAKLSSVKPYLGIWTIKNWTINLVHPNHQYVANHSKHTINPFNHPIISNQRQIYRLFFHI